MFSSPVGAITVSGNEERMFRHFAPRLIKVLRSQDHAERNNFHYEGTTIQGDGVFHKLSSLGKIVALHLALDRALERGAAPHPNSQWFNGAMECLYSWMLHEVLSELPTGDITHRTVILRAYQTVVSESRIDANDLNPTAWTNYVVKLAERSVFKPEKLKEVIGPLAFYSLNLEIAPKTIEEACKYFDDGMPHKFVPNPFDLPGAGFPNGPPL
jgi:hypothetical protein